MKQALPNVNLGRRKTGVSHSFAFFANERGLPSRGGRITEVTSWCANRDMTRCKIAAGSSVRRRYETTCRLPSAGRFECCVRDAGASSEHNYQRKHAPGPAGGQAASKSNEEVVQATAESNEEVRERAAEDEQKVEPSRGIARRVGRPRCRPSTRQAYRKCPACPRVSRVPRLSRIAQGDIRIIAKLRGQVPARQEPREARGPESRSFCRPDCRRKSLSPGCCSPRR